MSSSAPVPRHSRPSREDVPQLRLPGQAAAPPGPVDLSPMYLMHHAFRRDLAALAAAVRATPLADRRTWRELARRWTRFSTILHRHHSGEDAGLWPAVGERAREHGDDAAVVPLTAMSVEHAGIDPLLVQCTRGFARLAAGPHAAARATLLVAVEELRERLGAHLAHEERDAMALVQRHLSVEDWERVDREYFVAEYRPWEMAFLICWVLHLLPARGRSFVERHAPPGLVLVGRLLGPVFARYDRHLFRHADPGGRPWVSDPLPTSAPTSRGAAPDHAQADVVEAYRTCEFATMTRDGIPIAWPTVPVRREDGTLLVTTSIGLPRKALNVRRDSRVALLFSDPTASGLDGAGQVLVQGSACCPEEVVTAPERCEPLWSRLAVRQPSSSAYVATSAGRRLMDWYYMRLLITVTPVTWTSAPAIAPGTVPAGGPFAGYASAVLGTCEGGCPVLRRVRFRVGGSPDEILLTVPGEFEEGPASLLAHSHDEELSALRAVVALGAVTADPDGMPGHARLRVSRLVPGPSSSALSLLPTMLRLRRRAARYLADRGIPRPTVPWDRYPTST